MAFRPDTNNSAVHIALIAVALMVLPTTAVMVRADSGLAPSGYDIGGAVPLAGLVEHADLIIRGQVKSITHTQVPVESAEVKYVWQGEAEIDTSDIIKGRVENGSVIVRFRNGVDFEVGEDVIVLLAVGTGESFTTLAQGQGKFSIKGDRVERRNVAVAEFLEELNSIVRKDN